MEQTLMQRLEESKAFIRERFAAPIDCAIVLGSGLGDLAQKIENPVIIKYADIPHFPISTVPGHAGRLVIGRLAGKTVLCMQGRFHYYEGYSMAQVVYPVQVMHLLNIQTLILTNAAGCVNKAWKAGDLMLITDHIKLIADSPLRGQNCDELGPRFFDMSHAYDPALQDKARAAARKMSLNLREGVYELFTGPNFETPAEVRLARILGADAVGMSTVPETIAANHCGIKVLGISCLTNMAAGINDTALDHQEVLETGLRVKSTFETLVTGIVESL